ncbi:tail fiber domain-containing protein, partial [Limosilactobacillus mucosae]
LASQAKSLSSYAAQASAAGKDITTLKSQAGQFEQDMADTKGDVSQLKVSASSASVALSDAAGNISNLQASAKSYSAALSDTNSNVASVRATASELEAKYADAAGDISQIKSDAKGTAETIADTQGDIASLKKRADGFDTQFTNAKSDIAVIQSDATGTKETLTNAKSDIAVLQSRADGFDAKYADVAGDVDKLQTDAKGTTQTLADAKGDIAKLKTRADGFDTEFANANGDISKLQTDASGTKQTLTNAKSDIAVLQSRADGFDAKYADAAGDINTIKVNAKGMQQTLTNAKGDISTLQATATGFKNTLTDAQGNISTLQSDVSGLKKTTSDHAGNIATLQADAKTLTSQMADAQGNISTLQQNASGFSSKVSGMETSLANANNKINGITSNGGGRNLAKGTSSEDQSVGDASQTTGWQTPIIATFDNPQAGQQYTISVNTRNNGGSWKIQFWDGTSPTRRVKAVYYGPPIIAQEQKHIATITWPSGSNKYMLVQLVNSNDGGQIVWNSVMLEKGIVAHDWSPAPEDTDAKITTNSTAIDQNKKAIALKADQATVDKANGDVALLKAQLKVQADQINSKVSSSDLDARGYATQTYTQTQIKQTADSWNANLTSVKNGLTDSYTNLHATVDGIQAQVYNKDGSSRITQLSNVIAAKVSSSDLPDLVGGGGRNLAIGTSDSWTAVRDADRWNVITIATYPNAQAGDVFTISVDTQSTKPLAYQIWQGNSPDKHARTKYVTGGDHKAIASGTTHSHTTFTWPSGATQYLIVQLMNNATDGSHASYQYKNVMLEKGAIAHDWQPAPEDAQTYTQAQITLLKDDINLRVAKGNVVSQINQEAGGNTLIQVSNGQGKLALNASSVIFSGSAFIPDAYITTLNADKLRFYDDSGNVATMSAGLEQYDDDKTKRSIVLQYAGGYEVHASDLLGSILTMHDNSIRLAVKANGMASSGSDDQYSGVYVAQHYAQLSCYRSDGKAPGIYITDDGYTIKGDESGNGTKWGDLNITSPQIYVTGGNSVSLSGSNAVQMQVNKTHAWLSDGMLHLYKDGDSSSTATKLQVDGWAWVNGFVEAAGHSQHSALSTKTDIQSVDDDKMLKMVNDTDLATFLYKTDVANGETHRHIGLIIDDVHDVAQYQTPQDFIAPNGVSRDDDNMIGALFGAVKALTKRIKTLESKVG